MRIRSILYVTLFAVNACAAQPIIHDDFEQNEAGWIGFGSDSARVRITHDAAQVKNGKGALEFDYESSSTKPAVAILPVTESMGMQKMQSIGLWMMAESATAAAISLIEKQGGRYVAIFWLAPHSWQRVELTPEDFVLAQNATDPKDPDGKLDLDQIEAVGVIDVSQILNGALGKNAANLAVVTHSGPRKLFIDDFEVSSDRPAWFHPRGPYQIDSFEHPQLNWFTLGGPDLKSDTSRKVIAGSALESSYVQMADAFVLVVHQLPAVDFTGATHLAFDAASLSDAHLLFVLEQQGPGGARFHVDVEVKGGGNAQHREVPLSAFQPDENASATLGAKLDLSNLKSIAFLDITAAYTGESEENTIRLGNVEMVKIPALPK
jgi:hypothetical protein